MLDNRLAPVRAVVRTLKAAHQSQDATIVDLATLAIRMVEASQACDLPAHLGQEALTDVQLAFSGAVQVRGLTAQAHLKLADLRAHQTVPAQMLGDYCPVAQATSSDADTATRPALSVVA